MTTREIVETIQKRRAGGISDEQIHAILENQGLAEDDITAAIEASYKDISTLPEEALQKSPTPQKKKGWWPF